MARYNKMCKVIGDKQYDNFDSKFYVVAEKYFVYILVILITMLGLC